MLMAIFSYMTETTEEADRTFRFTVFLQFLQILGVVTAPFADVLYTWLGYTSKSFVNEGKSQKVILWFLFGQY